jgi:hypothetical protein
LSKPSRQRLTASGRLQENTIIGSIVAWFTSLLLLDSSSMDFKVIWLNGTFGKFSLIDFAFSIVSNTFCTSLIDSAPVI